MREQILAFLAILLELLFGTLLFFIIIYAAHLLEWGISLLHEPKDSFIGITAHVGEIALLIADCIIGIIFVTRGILNAWNATWGA